jgi:hypothetical protein
MTDKPNFILVPSEPEAAPPPVPTPAAPSPAQLPQPATAPGTLLERIRSWAMALLPQDAARMLTPPPDDDIPRRPRLIFGFDATASREPAWAMARGVTDSLVRALPGELDVALAVHGGGLLHTFTAFTSDANALRDRAAGITCIAGSTRLLSILARSLKAPGVRVVTYIGDVFEESPARGQKLADDMGARGIKLIVLHDTSHWSARRDAEIFADLARRTGGCVLPFDPTAPDRLRDILAAAAVYAVGGTDLLRQKSAEMPGAVMLLEHLRRD